MSRDPILFPLIGVVCLIDFFLIFVYVLLVVLRQAFGTELPPKADLNWVFSAASIWNYGKFTLTGALLVTLYIATRHRIFGCMAVLIAVLYTDDYLEVHDRLGEMIGARLQVGPFEGIGAQPLGEPFIYLAMLLIAIALFRIGLKGTSGRVRHFGWSYAVLIFILAAFGVGIDVLHSVQYILVDDMPMLDVAFEVVEDGGEMLAISFLMLNTIAIVAYFQAMHRDAATADSQPSDPFTQS